MVLVSGVAGAGAATPPLVYDSSPRSAAPGTRLLRQASTFEQELLAELNAIRARRGLVPLRRSPSLAAAARHHSRAMARLGFVSHSSADGSSFRARVERFYRRPPDWRVYAVGENLLSGSASVAAHEVMRLWMGSQGHRQNLLADWREVGFGAVKVKEPLSFDDEATLFVTADFGLRR